MSDLRDHLSKDTLPIPMLQEFVKWCIWEQSRPALCAILSRVGMTDSVAEFNRAQTPEHLIAASQSVRAIAQERRKLTGPFGYSSAEAAAFLMIKMISAASESEWDPAGVAFFSTQLSGWLAFAESDYAEPAKKSAGEAHAAQQQEARLQQLWQTYGQQS